MKSYMRDPLPITIFGDYEDQRLIALKCMLLKCGVNNFKSGQLDALGRCKIVDCERTGPFIVSMASVRPREMTSITLVANSLSVPVLHL